MKEIAVSKFKATCLAVLEQVRKNRNASPGDTLWTANR
jgi:hypothetical protein